MPVILLSWSFKFLKEFMFIQCILVLFFASNRVAIAQGNPEKWVTIESRLRRTEEGCFNMDWKSVTCSFPKRSEYHTEWYGIAGKATGTLKDLFDYAMFEAKPYCGGGTLSLFYLESIIKKNYLKDIDQKLKDIAGKSHLNDCQKACLAKCTSSSLIDYDRDSDFRSLMPEDILYRGYGLCQHFAHLANHFNDQLGLPSRWEGSFEMGHEFNKVKINGVWYYEEPQIPSCEFYPSPQNPL